MGHERSSDAREVDEYYDQKQWFAKCARGAHVVRTLQTAGTKEPRVKESLELYSSSHSNTTALRHHETRHKRATFRRAPTGGGGAAPAAHDGRIGPNRPMAP